MMNSPLENPTKKLTKVAFFCDFYSSLGGTESYNTVLIKELVNAGIEVRVYIGEKPRRSHWINELAKLGVPFKQPLTFHDDLSRREIEKEFIDSVVDEINLWKPDIIHTHPFKKMAITWLKTERANTSIPIVATEWTVPCKEASHWFEADTAEHINKTAAFIATCVTSRKGIRLHHKYNGPIRVIPHLLSTKPSKMKLPPTSNTESFSVGCIARLSTEKGIAYLLGAWRKVAAKKPLATLHIYGHGDDENTLKELTRCLGVEDSVFFEGTFSPGEVVSIAKKHDFFIQPSLFESIPTSIIELMLSGRTLIATRVGGIPELITNGRTGLLVDPGSTDQIARAIVRLADDRDLLEQLSNAAYKFSKDTYTTKENFKSILRLYQDVMHDNNSNDKTSQ